VVGIASSPSLTNDAPRITGPVGISFVDSIIADEAVDVLQLAVLDVQRVAAEAGAVREEHAGGLVGPHLGDIDPPPRRRGAAASGLGPRRAAPRPRCLFTVRRTAVGNYTLTFPAGTWRTFPAPVVVVTPQEFVGVSLVANLGTMNVIADGSATIEISLSSTAGPSTRVDGRFAFNASAPLTAGTGGRGAASVQRAKRGKPKPGARHGRKGR
jgi:hypothetical protein